MSSQSEFAGTAGQGNFASGEGWTNLSYAQGSGTSGDYASSPLTHSSPDNKSESIDFYDWGFSIPGGATINGVSFQIYAYDQLSTNIEFYETWVEAGSTAGNFTASGLATTRLSTSPSTYSTGSSTDLCDISAELTASNVNSDSEGSGLTVSVQFENTSGSLSSTVYAQAAETTIYYTASSANIVVLIVSQYDGGFVNGRSQS